MPSRSGAAKVPDRISVDDVLRRGAEGFPPELLAVGAAIPNSPLPCLTVSHDWVRHWDDDGPEDIWHQHQFFASVGDRLIALLYVNDFSDNPNQHEAPKYIVHTVETAGAWRRRGIATALFRYAETVLGPIAHSQWLSLDGQAWIRTLNA